MTINITNRELQEIIDTDFVSLIDDMDNLCHLIDEIEIEDDEIVFSN